MKTAIVTLESMSPYGQSKHYNLPKKDKENAKDYEARTWRERGHWNEQGQMVIPPMAFKNCLSECAKYLSIQVPGAGKATYTKHIEAGVLVTDGLLLPKVTKENVEGLWLFVPADGRRGGGKRVEKCFPIVQHWSGQVTYYILDETITQDVFKKIIGEAGKFIGIGFFRPRNNGFFGRFKVVDLDWQETD